MHRRLQSTVTQSGARLLILPVRFSPFVRPHSTHDLDVHNAPTRPAIVEILRVGFGHVGTFRCDIAARGSLVIRPTTNSPEDVNARICVVEGTQPVPPLR